MKRILCLVCCLLLSLTCAAAAEETPRIAAANYALTFAVEQICGHDWSIETVNPEGKADFMPDDAQLEALRACDLVVVFGTEAWVSKLDEARVLKVGDALKDVNPDAGEGFWLAPINMALVGYTVSDALAPGSDALHAAFARADVFVLPSPHAAHGAGRRRRPRASGARDGANMV